MWSSVVRAGCLAGVSALGLGAVPAYAQEPENAETTPASAQQAEPEQAAPSDAEIVITANRRSQLLQDVPLAVSALTGKDLEAANARSFADFARSVPGLSFSDYGVGRQKPSIRGISVNTGAAAVGYYIDETPIPSTSGTLRLTNIDPNLYDLDRVEVLRGPQGTLYGSGSMGGTIKLVTRGPNPNRFEGSARLSAETIDGGGPGFQFDGMINVPLVEDKLAFRAVISGRNADGFINRLVDGVTAKKDVPHQKVASLRAAIEFNPTENLRLNASIFHENQKFNGFQTVTFGTINPQGKLVQDFLFDTPEPNKNKFTLYNFTAELALPFANLLSSTSYYSGSYSAVEETGQLLATFIGPTFPSVIPERNTQKDFTQEIRLSSVERIAGFDWIVGAFYREGKGDRFVNYIVPEYAPIVGTSLLFFSDGENESEQKALFGELSFHPTDQLSITAGLRWYDVSSNGNVTADGLFNGGFTQTELSSSASGVVKKVNVAWEPNKDVLLYAHAAEGFRPGFGRNPVLPICEADAIARGIDPDANEVLPDKVWNYELGAKTTFLDGRATFNIAAFRIDWTDIQLGVFLPCGFNVPSNAGDVRSQGIEIESAFRLTEDFHVGGNLSYTDAKFKKIAQGSLATPGDPLLDVPEWQGSAYVMHKFFALGGEGFGRLEWQHTGKSLLFYDRVAATAPAPLSFRERPSLDLVNARVQLDRGKWSFALYGRNLTNDVEVVGFADMLSANLPDRPRFTVNSPRTLGAEVGVKF